MQETGAGWRFFAATVVGLAGIMRIFDSIWSFRYNGTLPNGLEDAIFGRDLKTYGWIYLILGIVLLVSSVAIVMVSEVGRWIGVVVGGVLAVSSIWWMPYYPIWSLLYIGLGLLVVYALVAHGGYDTDEV